VTQRRNSVLADAQADMAPRTCVQKSTDKLWYQCDGITWVTPVDAAAATGPAGACSHEYPL
jgi:hypothetical protein